MAALTCDICGGNLSMDSSGDFAVCESCGMKHTKDRVKAKVQEITGTVKVSNVTNYEDIWEAVKKGIVQDVAYFIENGVGVDTKGRFGLTPLHCAAEENPNVEVIKYLISKGADVNAKNNELVRTPLGSAIRNSNKEVLKYLVSQGADVNAKDNFGYTPLHSATKDIEVLKYLISKGAEVNAESNSGRTPLHSAARDANREVIKYLISQGADINAKDEDGKTPLDCAYPYEKKRIMFEEINQLSSSFEDFFSALRKGTAQDVKFFVMLDAAAVNAKDKDGGTPLHKAAWHNPNVEVFKYLVSQGADVNAKDKYGDTPLYSAIYNSNIEVLKYLVSQGADVNAKDKHSSTPLDIAIYNSNIEVLKYLVSQGADVNAKDEHSSTPLHLAAGNNPNVEVLKYLVSQGADVNSKNEFGRTPLDRVNDEIKRVLREAYKERSKQCKQQGICHYCGAEFKGGIFSKKCSRCGRKN